MVSRWENIAQMNQYMEREEEKGAGVSIMNMDCEEKRHYLALCVCVCVFKNKGHDAQSMFFKVTFSTALEMLTNLALNTEVTENC